MRLLIHDRDDEFHRRMEKRFDSVIFADGAYAPCLGCFQCWTKTPAACKLKDSLYEASRLLGQADDLLIVTENWYGGYSPAVKTILDRSIGTSTPLSTYRGGQMHHVLRYGEHNKMTVFVYGDIDQGEKETWQLLLERNTINEGFRSYELSFLETTEDLEAIA